jgi:CRISPR-associated protein Csb1
MPDTITYEILKAAVAGAAAAFRCRRRLQPAGGPGDKVFPPTFAGAVYAVEQRRIPDHPEPVTCVLLDSVQAQANRMELALQEAVDGKRLNLPIVEADFRQWGPTGDVEADRDAGKLIDAVGKISTLQVPHRLADAILRDCEIEETRNDEKVRVPFRQSKKGKELNKLSLSNATALYQLCPTALLFGMWDSTGPKGGLGAKFERAMVSEVVGIGAAVGDLARGVRRDPLEIRAAVKVLKAANKNWSLAAANAKGAVPPSEVNHSSVPFPKQRETKTEDNHYSGVTVEYSEQITTLSLIVLRRLRFPVSNGSAETDVAAQTVLAALGLCGATLAFENGMSLRSRCLLWPEGGMTWELLATPGKNPESYSLTPDQSIALFEQAVAGAVSAGLSWEDTPLILQPQQKLVELVRLSQLQETEAEG